VRSQASLLVQLGEFASRNLKRILIVLGVLLVVGLILYGHSEIRTDLRYALASASAQLSPLLVAYDTKGEFNGREVLELTQPEIQEAVKSWPSFKAPVYLQVFNIPEKVLFDSRRGEIRSYETIEPVSSHPRHGSWDKEGPFFYVDWNPSSEGRWILRVAVNAPNYFIAHAWRLPLFLLPLAVVGRLLLTSAEVRMRRRFDLLVSLMPKLLRPAERAEETLIQEVPQIIAHMLDFDSVAIYLLEGDRIVPRAYFSKSEQDREVFQHTTAEGPITSHGDDPESRAIRDNEPVLVRSPKEANRTLPPEFQAAASRPYIILPLRRGGGEDPIGLLTAQRHAGLERQHQDFLQSCAEIVALLLDNIRSRETLERLYRKMIRNTRIETLGTVVPFITHNMKTPLVVIEGLADSLVNDFGNLDRVELEKRVSEIKDQTTFSFQLIRSISQYNMLDNAPASLVKVRQGLERVCGFFGGYFRIKNIQLVQEYQKDFEPSIKMDELDFIQVITNLLINVDDAFSELRQSGDERMSRDSLTIGVVLESEGESARISITDNGPGIRPEDLPRVFVQEFTTKDFGTGVGLPYCRRVVEQAGGTIKVDSVCGKGTSVSIVIPIIKGEVR
jgi:signal transduction histidine kinase